MTPAIAPLAPMVGTSSSGFMNTCASAAAAPQKR